MDRESVGESGLNITDFDSVLSKCFGELEIWGLIIISYYSLNYADLVDSWIARRCSKLIILLTRKIVIQSKDNPQFIHLLSILLQLVSTGIKIHHKNYENVKILEDIIKLLLTTYNNYRISNQPDHRIVVSLFDHRNSMSSISSWLKLPTLNYTSSVQLLKVCMRSVNHSHMNS